ncbi:hypothetical protein [Pantoea endophytica]
MTHRENETGVLAWNDEKLWRNCYEGMANDHFFFAQDAFGGQFCFKEDGIYTFDPEVGESQKLCDTLSEWCEAILDEYDFLTGHSLMHKWQATHGRVLEGQRLAPAIPFILGGEFSVDNLRAQQSVTAMRYRGSIAFRYEICLMVERSNLVLIIKNQENQFTSVNKRNCSCK